MLGVGKSLSFLIFGTTNHEILFGILFGLFMAFLLKGGIRTLKKLEKGGLVVIFVLFLAILFILFPSIQLSNLTNFNSEFLFLPFGIVLFALMSFHAIPETRYILRGKEKLFKKVILVSSSISILFYILFTWVILGSFGTSTPEVATLALGPIFIFLGILTMFTSYLATGNALMENFEFDEKYNSDASWLLTSVVPIGLFLLTQLFDFFSFTRILSIGGVVSGGIIAVLSLLMIRNAKKKRKS